MNEISSLLGPRRKSLSGCCQKNMPGSYFRNRHTR